MYMFEYLMYIFEVQMCMLGYLKTPDIILPLVSSRKLDWTHTFDTHCIYPLHLDNMLKISNVFTFCCPVSYLHIKHQCIWKSRRKDKSLAKAPALPTCTYINTAHHLHVNPSSCNAPQYYILHLPNVKDFTCQWGTLLLKGLKNFL